MTGVPAWPSRGFASPFPYLHPPQREELAIANRSFSQGRADFTVMSWPQASYSARHWSSFPKLSDQLLSKLSSPQSAAEQSVRWVAPPGHSTAGRTVGVPGIIVQLQNLSGNSRKKNHAVEFSHWLESQMKCSINPPQLNCSPVCRELQQALSSFKCLQALMEMNCQAL